MIKKVFSLIIFVSIYAGAETRVIGNGGDVKEEFPVSVSYLQNQLPDAHLFIRTWLQGLETQMKLDHGLGGPNPRRLTIPKGAQKLFSDRISNSIYYKIDRLKIEFRTRQACSSDKGKSDGSVVSESPPTICISGYTLAKKLNEGNAKIQLEALIVHELSHLVGTNEEEAVSIQSQYLEDMRFVSKESIVKYYSETIEKLHGVSHFHIPQMIFKLGDFQALCKMVLDTRFTTGEIGRNSEITPISIFSAEMRDEVDDLNIWVSQVLHLYICSQNPILPIAHWLEDYKKGFQGNKWVDIKDWSANRGTKGIRKTTSQLQVSYIENETELRNQLLSVSVTAASIQSKLVFEFLKGFDIVLIEN